MQWQKNISFVHHQTYTSDMATTGFTFVCHLSWGNSSSLVIQMLQLTYGIAQCSVVCYVSILWMQQIIMATTYSDTLQIIAYCFLNSIYFGNLSIQMQSETQQGKDKRMKSLTHNTWKQSLGTSLIIQGQRPD